MASKAKCYSVTVRGIALKIPKDALDDIGLVELLGDMQDGDIFAFPKAAKMLFGESYADVIAGLADANGKTRLSDTVEFFNEVLTACSEDEAKNS